MKQCHPESYLSAMLTSLPCDFATAVQQARELGFSHVDIVAQIERPIADVEALADSGLLVSCASIGRDLPGDHTLDAERIELRRAALAAMQRQITDAAQLGATHCYVVPGRDDSAAALERFADACGVLANFAAERKLQLCVEHCPGRALPSVAATLAWLANSPHASLKLLLDIGHCLITQEDPAQAIRQAGPWLGYIHFDDNDGEGDLHWPLLEGRLTKEMLQSALRALKAIGHQGALCLELNPSNADPVAALRDGRDLLQRLLAAE